MIHPCFRLLLLLPVIAMLTAGSSPAADSPSQKWESTIEKFEAQDQKSPPPQNALLFIGSSSIRMWDLQKWFPDRRTINRGFGGSETADSLYYADRILLPYKPKVVVLYAGDNDIAKGKSPDEVFHDWQAFVAKVHGELPDTKIVYVAIKPSIARWKLVDKMRATNALIAKDCAKHQKLAYVDIDKPMLGDDGKPREELFKDDGLHLNEKGYQLWSDLVRPELTVKTNR
jgi:lysophospholipase L1-like esterase